MRNIMILDRISQLTPKRIIIFLVLIAAAIYVVWYIFEALDGLNPNYKPYAPSASSSTGNIIKGGAEIFDPSKTTPESK